MSHCRFVPRPELEADLAFRIPGELDCRCGHCVVARRVDGRFPLAVVEVSVDLEVCTDPLHDLKIDIVQRRSAIDQCSRPWIGFSGRAGNEIFGCFVISDASLNPLISA